MSPTPDVGDLARCPSGDIRDLEARPLIGLERKAAALPRLSAAPRYAVCARESIDKADDVLAVTAADIFGINARRV